MANIKEAFSAVNQAITCSFNSLASGSYWQSSVIDNTTNLYLDALISIIIASGASGIVNSGTVSVYAYATTDGTNYTDGASGTDSAFTPTNPTNLVLVGNVNVVATSATYKGGPFSVAKAFGGILPAKWGLVILNNAGGALASTGNSVNYQGVYATSI